MCCQQEAIWFQLSQLLCFSPQAWVGEGYYHDLCFIDVVAKTFHESMWHREGSPHCMNPQALPEAAT